MPATSNEGSGLSRGKLQKEDKMHLQIFLCQVPICQPDQLQCVKNVNIIDDKCISACEGLIVTSYFKSKMEESTFADFWTKVEADYMKYKSRAHHVNFPEEFKGLH